MSPTSRSDGRDRNEIPLVGDQEVADHGWEESHEIGDGPDDRERVRVGRDDADADRG